ncbi:MAG TPA: alpha-L-fucosidase [Candidatus Mediterraneibacter cottocaccae]|nr:alpha-L-fucosidase [Candidatus Mediterraneibacter cottocaccae]
MEKLNSNNTEIHWQNICHRIPDWFADAKFGLFFHWGPYSVPAFKDEWYSRNMYAKGLPHNIHHEETYGNLKDFGYKDFYPMMTGSRFDPDEWAELVVRSGARYAGPVSEHSDNFSLWNSSVNPVNSVNYGPHRDVVGECFHAFRQRGIRTLATFHHQWLWGWFMSTDPDADVYVPENEMYYGPALPLETNRYIPYRLPDSRFCATWRKKVEEVVDQYDPDVVYFDSRSMIIREEDRYRVAEYYYRKTGADRGVITYKQNDFPDGIGALDLERGAFSDPAPYPWQSDDRLEDNITWCMVQNPKYRSASSVIQQLCDIVSKNGNLLLNVGPYADGSFHPDAVKELYAIGDWLKINGEAIYGSRPFTTAAEGPSVSVAQNYDASKIEEQLRTGSEAAMEKSALTSRDFRFTTGNGNIYAISMGWPDSNVWEIHTLKAGTVKVNAVSLLGCSTPLSFTQTETGLYVQAPGKRPCSHAYTLKIS